MEIVITAQELATRKSQGTVHLCISCKEKAGKLVMLGHDLTGRVGVVHGLCQACLSKASGCATCRNK